MGGAVAQVRDPSVGGDAMPGLHRRTLLARTAGTAAAAALPGALAAGCGRSLVPAAAQPEPPLVHYRMPYGSAALQPGPALERTYDEMALLAALQGIVNRDAPRLYVLGVTGPGAQDLDAFWWARMAELGWSVAKARPTQAKDLQELLGMFGHRTRGLVVWDPAVPATQNVAATLAGVLDLLPVAQRKAPAGLAKEPLWQQLASGAVAPLYGDLVKAGWGVGLRLVHPDGSSMFTGKGTIPGTKLPSTGSAKDDAYIWAKVHYLDTGRTSATHMAYYIDAYWLRNPGAGGTIWNNTLVNHDYFVSERAFFFDLDPWTDEAPVDDPGQKPGTDAATLVSLLQSANRRTGGRHMINVGGFPPWAFKYTNVGKAGGKHGGVATEWTYAETLSSYNAFMEADALGYAGIANASFTRHLPLRSTYPQPPAPDRAALRRRGFLRPDGSVKPARYFAFYVGDFDSPAWLYHIAPTIWNDPARGSLPLSWAFDPNLCLRAAPAMAWTRATATAQDTFVAGDSGAGYLNPGALETPRSSGLPSGMATWAAHCRRFFRQWDLKVTGFIIEGDSPAMGPGGFKAYQTFSPGGIVGQKVPRLGLVDGMPVMAMNTDIGGTPSQAAASVRALFLPESGAQFAVARAVLQTPSWYLAASKGITARASGDTSPPIQVVDLPTLLALVAEHERHGGAPARGRRGAATLTVTAAGLKDAGLRPVSAPDGRWHLGKAGARAAVIFARNPFAPHGDSYFYLRVTPGLFSSPGATPWLQVRYYDAPAGLALQCDYNAATPYTAAGPVTTTGSHRWKTVTWALGGADFKGSQNGGADLRLDAPVGLAIDRVALTNTRPAAGG